MVDFDIENYDEFQNYTVQDRILGGLKIVKQNNPNVKVVVTFGTGTSGPGADGIRLINQSKALNVPIDNYTIMPFDFGGGANMYGNTTAATDGLRNALKTTFGWTDATAYAMSASTDAFRLTASFSSVCATSCSPRALKHIARNGRTPCRFGFCSSTSRRRSCAASISPR